jgi:hypothetical protein
MLEMNKHCCKHSIQIQNIFEKNIDELDGELSSIATNDG